MLTRGVDLDLELAVCRRIVKDSCPYNGSRPLSLVELIATIRVGSTVVVALGYNDPATTFADDVETAMTALRKAGVERVLWLTLRAERESYIAMNDSLRAAAARHPDLRVVDWNLYSRSHPDWFQDDGLHLNREGSVAMATLVHRALADAGAVAAPLAAQLAIVTRSLPPARVGRPYLARLAVAGGSRPVRWSRNAGLLPPGLQLRPDGRLTGTPRTSVRVLPALRATDADGRSVVRRFALVVKPR